jgi:hypothetical protein
MQQDTLVEAGLIAQTDGRISLEMIDIMAHLGILSVWRSFWGKGRQKIVRRE